MKAPEIIPVRCAEIDAALNNAVGRFTVKLSNRGNPDYGQDPDCPLYETLCGVARVDSLKDAVKIARLYIRFYELGAGNWNGGQIFCDDVFIGRMNFNGRVWNTEKYTSQAKEVLL